MYSAISATEWSIGTSVNGTGRRERIEGAYTIDKNGRRVRAFTNKEGGLEAATRWAETLNDRYGMSK